MDNMTSFTCWMSSKNDETRWASKWGKSHRTSSVNIYRLCDMPQFAATWFSAILIFFGYTCYHTIWDYNHTYLFVGPRDIIVLFGLVDAERMVTTRGCLLIWNLKLSGSKWWLVLPRKQYCRYHDTIPKANGVSYIILRQCLLNWLVVYTIQGSSTKKLPHTVGEKKMTYGSKRSFWTTTVGHVRGRHLNPRSSHSFWWTTGVLAISPFWTYILRINDKHREGSNPENRLSKHVSIASLCLPLCALQMVHFRPSC